MGYKNRLEINKKMKLRLRTTEVFSWNKDYLEKAYNNNLRWKELDNIENELHPDDPGIDSIKKEKDMLSFDKYIINQGGSRSSKTYSILQMMIWKCLTTTNLKCSVVRKTLKSMKDSVISDFLTIMKDLEIYDENRHNKTESVYEFHTGSIINFFGADDDKKLRGTKRDILYINESNEIDRDVFIQLDMRTSLIIFLDYNPSDYDNWVYDLLNRDNAKMIKSTYLNNSFLSKTQIDTIESLIETDENYYRIYALGERPISKTRIFEHFNFVDNIDTNTIQYTSYGLDFGFNHATALVEVNHLLDGYFIKEKIYSSRLTNSDLIEEMERLRISKIDKIWADAARPDAIEDLRRAGFNVHPANKDVGGGIDLMKRSKIFVSKSSTNIWEEYKRYNWKTRGDIILNEPVKLYDDALDAVRYGIWNEYKSGSSKAGEWFFTI
jgi:phage terminase large subunit